MASGTQSTRVPAVVLGSAAAYLVLGLVFYVLYSMIGQAVYDRRLHEGLARLQVVFYVAFALHFITSVTVALALTRRAHAPPYHVLFFTAILYAIAVYPTLLVVSALNFCETNVSFPIPGQTGC